MATDVKILYLFLFRLCLDNLISATNKIWGSFIFWLFSSAVDTGLLEHNETVTGHGPVSPVQWQPSWQSIFRAERNESYPQTPLKEEFCKEVMKEHLFPDSFLCFTSTANYTTVLSRKKKECIAKKKPTKRAGDVIQQV